MLPEPPPEPPPPTLRDVRVGVLAITGDVHVVATAATASFVAFSLGAADGARLVERAAVVYVDPDDGGVRDVDHEWHERLECAGRRAWLPPAEDGLDDLRLVGDGPAVSWTRVAPAPAWLGDGPALWHGTGGPVTGFGALPDDVRALVEAERPEFAFAPLLDLATALHGLPDRGLRTAARSLTRARRSRR